MLYEFSIPYDYKEDTAGNSIDISLFQKWKTKQL